jgi:excisionase family DNA binding protein
LNKEVTMDLAEQRQEQGEQFLSLGEAAQALGVHPSTIRLWSDQGRIPVYRTQGGHRRYRISEIRVWQQRLEESGECAERVLRLAMVNARKLDTESQLLTEPWYQKLDASAREACRTAGLAIADGLAWHLTSSPARQEETAQSIGRSFGGRCLRLGLSRIDACQAFLYFRGVLLDALMAVGEDSRAATSCAWAEMLRKTADFTDEALLAFLQAYE